MDPSRCLAKKFWRNGKEKMEGNRGFHWPLTVKNQDNYFPFSRSLKSPKWKKKPFKSSAWDSGWPQLVNTLSAEVTKKKKKKHESAAPCQNIVSPFSHILKYPHIFYPFEETRVLKWDRTARNSITLIEVDKNTNRALLNFWHWTGWIKPRILTTGDGLEWNGASFVSRKVCSEGGGLWKGKKMS